MKILVLTNIEVEKLLPMDECINVMAEALAALARGKMYQPLRMVVRPPHAAGLMALMPAYRIGDDSAFGLKAICFSPGNPAKGKDAHQGSMMLFSGETGELLTVMNASAITAIRTAAVSAVATRLLARQEAGELAIIGAGVQARSHLAAICGVREIKRARIASRQFEHARRLAEEAQPKYAFPIEPVETPKLALNGADLIVTATTAGQPVLKREWITDGAHINAVGTFSPTAREIDTATMADCGLFTDRRESLLNESGDYLLAAQEGAIGPDHIRAELGELLTGVKSGRDSANEITLFKSLGLAIEDLASAQYLYQKAQPKHLGTWIEF
jgi:ornithine cyclodeaminase/alanine dehydrogenase-like protein (mu-crystallin family)